MKKVETCLTPELIHQFDLNGKTVVVVDIFRATSCMVTGMAFGVEAIRPVTSVDEAFDLRKQGYLLAGERGGQRIEGFELGNSPFDYMKEGLQKEKIAITTTNGTRAINESLNAQEILIGAFLNLEATATYIDHSNRDVVIHCAGWKGTINIEDSLFAGALIDQLKDFEPADDTSLIAHELFQSNRNQLSTIAGKSGHAKRLAGFGVEKDLEFCLEQNQFDCVVRLDGNHLKT